MFDLFQLSHSQTPVDFIIVTFADERHLQEITFLPIDDPVEKLDHLPRLLRVLALHSGQLTNFTPIGVQLRLDDKTVRKYIAVFEQLYLVRRLEPWFSNRLKRLVKTPKLHFLDSGLLAALLGITPNGVAKDRTLFGPLLETFVFANEWGLIRPFRCPIGHFGVWSQ